MINLILWLLLGALVGWLASIVMRTDYEQGPLLNIVGFFRNCREQH